MLSKITKILGKHETILLLLLILVSIIIYCCNPAFLSIATIFEIFRGAVPYSLMGLGILPVLLIGEIDISFVGIAAVTSLVAHSSLTNLGYTGGLGGYILIALPLGATIALIIGSISVFFGLPIFAVSLGFWLMLYGFNLFFISPEMRFDLPEGLVGFYGHFLVKVRDPIVGETGLHIAVIYVLLTAAIIWLMLRYTVIGRGFYIMGGNREVAFRTGYSRLVLVCVAMALNGALAAFAGVLQCAYKRFFDPILFRGAELYVIASAVIGGISITGGKGSVIGVLLGVIFVQVITRGLIYMGIEPTWQQFVIGCMLIVLFFITSPRLRLFTANLWAQILHHEGRK
ncbi:MAG: ABC transporter permease [Candidatus Methanomethyliaceae archaeon]